MMQGGFAAACELRLDVERCARSPVSESDLPARGARRAAARAAGAWRLRRNAQAWKAFLLVGGVLLVVAAVSAGVALALGVSEPSLFPVLPDAQTPFGILHFTTGGITLG